MTNQQAWGLTHPLSMKLRVRAGQGLCGVGIWWLLPEVCELWVTFLELTTDLMKLSFHQ